MLDSQPVSIVASSPDTNHSTQQTVALMRSYIQAAATHQPVLDAAREALQSVPMNAPGWVKAQAIWEWVTRHIRFKTDEQALRELGLPEDLELLISPYILASAPQWVRLVLVLPTGETISRTVRIEGGDCDDFTMLTNAMCQCAGLDTRIVTIAADPDQPDRWSHVYALAVLENGERMPLDTAAAAQGHGMYAGWEAPRAYRRQEWAC